MGAENQPEARFESCSEQMIDIERTSLSGLFRVSFRKREDLRGSFVKTWHQSTFEEHGLGVSFQESYYSLSKLNVLRGFHFQTPPDDHVKFVYCVSGRVLDVALDLRAASSTYGQCYSQVLDSSEPEGLFIPKGLGHAFLTLSEEAILVYNVTSIYSPKNDAGILWSSVDLQWPVRDPVISPRDEAFPTLSDFRTPF